MFTDDWLTQHFLYYLSERKFGRHPSLPDFSALLQHLHTKMLDGFLGWLPASWLEQVHPRAAPPVAPVAQDYQATKASQGAVDPVMMNTNYITSIKKCWQASGHTTIAQMLQVHTGEGTFPVPMVGDQSACLSWILKGCCFANCL